MNKHLVFADGCGIEEAVQFVRDAAERGCECELHWVGQAEDVDKHIYPWHYRWESEYTHRITDYLRQQSMGTKVHLFLARALWKEVNSLCLGVGMSTEEIGGVAVGPMLERVLCIGCYGLNPPTLAEQIACVHCGRTLSVSTLYSERLDAVIGYLTLSHALEVVADD